MNLIGNDTYLGKALRLPLKLIPENARMPILRGRLKGTKWIVGSSNNSSCWLGHYEKDQRLVIEQLVQEGDVVFDVGAHVGFYTLLFSRLVGPRGEVIAFEPLARNLHFLREHLRINNVENVKILETALFDSDGEVFFAADNFVDARISDDGDVTVSTSTLDNLMKNTPLPPPDYMKMDIEGAENMALIGARQTLEKHHPVIFLTTHGPEIHRQCVDMLEEIGYTLTFIDNEGHAGISRQIIARFED